MAATWKEQLLQQLIKANGNKAGLALNKKYGDSFPHAYLDEYSVATAVSDIQSIERLSAEHPLEIHLYFCKNKNETSLHLRLLQWQQKIPLSDILPILENFDLRTDDEQTHKILLDQESCAWISDFTIMYQKAPFEIDTIQSLFRDAFSAIYFGFSENDGFNKLILGAKLSFREVSVLRAYAKYLHQIGFRFSQPYIEKALVQQAEIAKNLVALFLTLHDPKKTTHVKSQAKKIEDQIAEALSHVQSLDEDKIIRRLIDLIKATLRTNYFQLTAENKVKPYLSLKFSSRAIPEMPLPIPLYEIFVYSPQFEGIHLRNTKVARGGIRYSDRSEDFRTEILGLEKAQTVKNAIIVPSGAKGGFVLKSSTDMVHCYSSFIQGLLDLTDNIKDKKFIRPKQVICYDDVDPYLVVAADKGTAKLSDTANAIAKKYDYWLGDAFASGGATGYDHKKMGITARGAWESIKRHFRELNIDVTQQNIRIIGIGDMSGDVFGNGMIYSKHIELVAAFDHRHIFLDPTPDAEVSYYERVRLFNLATSSWGDYNSKLLSKGGGIYPRSLKSITLTPQIKQLLDVTDNELSPTDLVRAILKAPVDLLFNGGIGTYVKACSESQADVGDRSNDYCRINGGELRCNVVGEGGNLGFTQRGRIEYALNGGRINTDFIDNSAGVDCSDHEVNLKILLDNEVHKGKLTTKKRNDLLASLTEEVAKLVLHDNYQQALVMSFSIFHAQKNIGLHTNYIKELESQGILDRSVEYMPDDKVLMERKAAAGSLTSPELAVLLAYTKIDVKHQILATNLPEDPFLQKIVTTAFPPSVAKKYQTAMTDHTLYRDIIATQISNKMVNEMGITFVYRLQMETGAIIEEIIRAYTVASHIFDTQELQKLVESLDFKIAMDEQYDMLFHLRNLISLATRWFLYGNHLNNDLEKIIAHYSQRIKALENLTPTLMAGFTKNYFDALTENFLKVGLPKKIAEQIATYRAIYTSLNIIEVATNNNFDLEKTARVYFAGGERVNLLWFRDQIVKDSREGHWNTLARLTLRDEFDIAQRALTVAILKKDKKEADTDKLVDYWVTDNQRALQRWDKLLVMLHGSSDIDYTMFFIAVRELIGLVLASQ